MHLFLFKDRCIVYKMVWLVPKCMHYRVHRWLPVSTIRKAFFQIKPVENTKLRAPHAVVLYYKASQYVKPYPNPHILFIWKAELETRPFKDRNRVNSKHSYVKPILQFTMPLETCRRHYVKNDCVSPIMLHFTLALIRSFTIKSWGTLQIPLWQIAN